MSHERILIIGASGLLGGATARLLLDAKAPLVLASRKPERLRPFEALGAKITSADLRDAASLQSAFQGVSRVMISVQSILGLAKAAPRHVDHEGMLQAIDLAKKAGVRHLVYSSVYGARPDHPVDVFGIKYAVEQCLKASGVPYTILRPTAFMETWAEMIGKPIRRFRLAPLVGDPKTLRNYIAVEDVAAFAAAALRSEHAPNAIVDITGPENLSLEQVAATYERVLGRRALKIRIPPACVRGISIAMRLGLPDLSRRLEACFLRIPADEFTPDCSSWPKWVSIQPTTLEALIRKKCSPK